MSLPPVLNAARHAYVGQSGTGKSHAAKLAVAQYLKAQGARVVVIDPDDEWSKLGEKSAHVTLGPCTHRVLFEELISDPGRHLDRERVALSVVVDDNEDEASQQIAEFVEVVKDTGDLLVVFEESGAYAGPDVSEQAGKKAMAKIATRGRHWGCPVIFCAQRLVQIPPSARAQLTDLQIFRQVLPSDLDALTELAGRSGAKVRRLAGAERWHSGRELPDVIAGLADREFAVWSATMQAPGKSNAVNEGEQKK